jgi:cytochrome P450
VTVEFDLTGPELKTDPTGLFARMRAECPVHRTETPSTHYSLTREADVSAALRDTDTWSSKFGPGLAYAPEGSGVLVASDPPLHTVERLAIARAFKPSVLEAMEPDIRRLINRLMDGLADTTEGDIVEDFAMLIPLYVMCWLLGLPEDDVMQFRHWVLPLSEAVAYAKGQSATQETIDANIAMTAYFDAHIHRRMTAFEAGEAVPEDLLTRMLTVERDGQRLTHAQVMGFCRFLLIAGSGTTTLLISNMIKRLMEFPDQLALVQRDRSLIPNVVEESLRFDAPVHGLFRTNRCPVTLHDVEIPENSKVLMMFGSANRDPEAWDDPDRFDITRDLTTLKRHAAFGVGIHYCLGAPLSRIEGAVALESILDRMPKIRPDGDPRIVKAGVLHGYEKLPVRWD